MPDKKKYEGLTLEELHEKRNKIIHDQREMVDKAQEEKREFTSEEDEKYNNMDVDFDELTDYIKTFVDEAEAKRSKELREKKLAEREAFMKESQGRFTKPDVDNPDPNKDKDKRNDEDLVEYRVKEKFKNLLNSFRSICGTHRATKKYLEVYTRYLKRGVNGISFEDRNYLENISSQFRALQADKDDTGGYLVAPEQMVMKIIEELDNLFFVRRHANVISLPNAASIGAPARDTDMGDLTWTSEITTGSEDSSLDFAKRNMTPHPLARRIKASRKVLRLSMLDIAGYIAKRFAYKLGAVEENAFLNGSGVNQPLGIFTQSDSGITASQDVSTGNTTTSIKGDGLIECVYAMPAQYRMLPSLRWIFHRSALKQIRKLKDGNGQYLWQTGITGDRPATICDYPYDESEYAPSTFTTGKIVGALGAWETYWIVDSLAFEIIRLEELYAETDQVGFICRKETDGMPTLAQAFRRVKLA